MQADKPRPTSALPKLLLYLLVVMVGGALLAPLLFDLGRDGVAWIKGSSFGESGLAKWLTDSVERAHFTRFFNRAVLLCALVFIWPFLKSVKLDRTLLPAWKPYGSGLGQALVGFGMAAGLLLIMGSIFYRLGAYQFRTEPGWWKLGEPITAALGASIVEEFFFRALLMGLLLRTMSTKSAVFWGTFVFAIVHFLKPPEGWKIPDDLVAWDSGFVVLGQIARGFGDMNFLLAEFATLFAVGLVLTLARMRTGRLWTGIGLHAGWVFGLKWFTGLMSYQKGWLPWIGPNLKIGLAPLVTVLITGGLVLWLLKGVGSSAGTRGLEKE
ncbi:MAG: CPBP family intramembrane glutamic endopeptidase [Verrucomicrobiota bacterium]